MNDYLRFALSMIVMYLRSTIKSPKAIAVLVKTVGPILIEVDMLIQQIIATIPTTALTKTQKALASGKTFALKIDK